MTTLLLSHESFLHHAVPEGHPERPDRMRALSNALAGESFSGLHREDCPLGDLAFANLEVTLSDTPPFSGYPRFISSGALATDLKDAGFDVLVTANNHVNDAGIKGLTKTADILDTLGFLRTGSFRDSVEKQRLHPLIIERKKGGISFKIALINYTFSTNGLPTRPPTMVNMIDSTAILADITSAKTHRPDLIIAFMHWGNEYNRRQSAEQDRLAQMMWENGVHWVIGAHPHVVQPVVTPEIGGRKVFGAFSLGNFISVQEKTYTDIGLMLNLKLRKDRTGKVTWQTGNNRYVWRYFRPRANGYHVFVESDTNPGTTPSE